MTSPFPTSFDSDATLPLISSNITQLGGQAINALRSAIFNIEANIGLNAQGATSSIAQRLGASLDANGNILPSAIASMGLVTLPIVDSMISATAAIEESKLALTYTTTYLNNFITTVNAAAQTGLSFIANHGFKLEPHLSGVDYNHYMNAILVALSSAQYFNSASGAVRNNTNLYTLFNDINNDLVSHEVANGTPVTFVDGLQVGGTLPPINYAHVSAGLYLDPATFSFIPQTVTDVQAFADFIDSSNVLIIGTRIVTLYANGIPINARAGALPNQTLGQLLVPQTNAQTYLLSGAASNPVDSIDDGDDLVEFFPSSTSSSNNSFDAMFNSIKVGDILTVDYDGYGSFTTQHIIREIKYSVSGGNKRYVVRINGKNIYNTSVLASINSPLFNNNKYGVLALSQVETLVPGINPTLIAGCPRGAEVLSVGFDADLISSTHYLLYINVYPDGNPLDQVITVPAIDISGNAGVTPGSYTLDGVVSAINNQFRSPGYNNRFMAFQYNGELGIKMTDAINNISFSILDGIVGSNGSYNQSSSNTTYPNNAIGVPGFDLVDASGFGPNGAGVSGPAFSSTYSSPLASLIPTKVWCPLSRKTYYVNGTELESFALEPFQLIDGYGDGYWPSTIISKTIVPGSRVQVTYQVPFDLAYSTLEIGKTITAIAQAGGTFVDDGRYFITNIQFNNCALCGNPDIISTTNITVYDAVQSPSGDTPYASAPVGTTVFLYFNSDSISFNAENVSDWTSVSTFKRSMEIFVDDDGYTFTQERGRMNVNGSSIDLTTINGIVPIFSSAYLTSLNVVSISPKLRGYAFGTIDKINLTLTSYNVDTCVYTGYLCKWDGYTESNQGPVTVGKRGNIVRFYDSSYVEYIDIAVDFSDTLAGFTSAQRQDIQLFPTLQLDEEIMFLGTVQLNEITEGLDWLQDGRQYGNVSVEQLSTSAINYISAPTQLINENGIIRGFGVTSTSTGSGTITVDGGVAVVNGNIIQLGPEVINVPTVVEVLFPSFTTQISTITWYLCVNQEGELEFIASTDYDPFGSTAAIYTAAGLDHTRMFYASNPTTGNNYPIRGTYFADLILNNRDVTPIAIITATVSGSPASITTITAPNNVDARRFMYNGYAGLSTPFVLSTSGSFQSLTSLNNWLVQLINLNAGYSDAQNFIGTKVLVKGNFPITSATTLSFESPVTFVGDGGAFEVTTPVAFNLGNRVHFDGITFNYNYDPSIPGDPGYLTTNLANSQNGCLYCSVGLNIDISIKNCIFNWIPYSSSVPGGPSLVVNRYPFISFQFSANGNVIEGVNICDNIFNSTLAGQPDIRAAIAFVSTIQTNQLLDVGVQLVNCTISNNKCYQDQLFLISTLVSGSLTIESAITTINTNIQYNQCGTIGFITRYYNTNDYMYFDISPGGKNPSLAISNNTCKLIDALDGYGAEVWSTALIATNIVTGDVIISDNTVSWIRVLLNADDTSARSTAAVIKNNNLSAYNTAFRFNYNSSYSAAVSDNAAISVVNLSYTTFGFATIDGNHINRGLYFTNTFSPEIYYYDWGIISNHSSTIVNNIVSSLGTVISGANPYGIIVSQYSSNIENNRLYRGSTPWTLYVSCFSISSTQHLVANNFFDSTTVNDINTQVIFAGGAFFATAYANINQIVSQSVALTDFVNYMNFLENGGVQNTTYPAFPVRDFTIPSTTNAPSSGANITDVTVRRVLGYNSSVPAMGVPAAAYISVQDTCATDAGLQRDISFTIPIDTLLPSNVKILNVSIGIYLFEPAVMSCHRPISILSVREIIKYHFQLYHMIMKLWVSNNRCCQ